MALLGAADIIDRSWEVVRRHPAPIFGLVAVALIPSLVASALFELVVSRATLPPYATLIAGFALYLPIALLSMLQTMALVRSIAAGLTGAPIPAIGVQLRQSLPLLPATILATLALTVLLLAGFVVLIVPAILFAVWFAFILQAIALDGANWMESFSRSKALSAGRFFPVFWRIAAPYLFWLLVSWVITAVVIFAFNTAAGSFSIRLAADAPSWVRIAAAITTDVVGALTAPFLIATSTALYLGLKKEMPGPREA